MKIQTEFEKWFRTTGTHTKKTWEILLERKEGKYQMGPTQLKFEAFKTGYEAALKEVDCSIGIWQPIETAPTMRQVIVAIPPNRNEGWVVGEAYLADDGGWFWVGSAPGYHYSIQDANGTRPTLWQPLPEPPAEQPKPALMHIDA